MTSLTWMTQFLGSKNNSPSPFSPPHPTPSPSVFNDQVNRWSFLSLESTQSTHVPYLLGSITSIPYPGHPHGHDGQVAQHLLGDKTWLHYWPRRMASRAGYLGELRDRPQLVVVTWRTHRGSGDWKHGGDMLPLLCYIYIWYYMYIIIIWLHIYI